MNAILKGAAKRLTFSLVIATSLGGCAVYDPGYYSGYDTYNPNYAYGAPAYSGAPYYVGPPISLDLWWVGGGGHRHGHGHHGFRGGHRGAWAGRHR